MKKHNEERTQADFPPWIESVIVFSVGSNGTPERSNDYLKSAWRAAPVVVFWRGVEERDAEDRARNAAARAVLENSTHTHEIFKEPPGQGKKPRGFILTSKREKLRIAGAYYPLFPSDRQWCFRQRPPPAWRCNGCVHEITVNHSY